MFRRNAQCRREKHIGKICADLIEDNDTIFIGSGTTSRFILDYLDTKPVMLVTNSIQIFQEAIKLPNVETILTGGVTKNGHTHRLFCQ